MADLRRDYSLAELDEAHTDANPIVQFGRWFAEAQAAELTEPNAMTLATADTAGRPSARIVLLKQVDAEGFVFFTDYRSHKGRELDANPFAALVFHWPELERQVRVAGRAVRLSREDSWEYFRTRPAASRVGAWASHQSAPLANRSDLDARVQALSAEYANGEIPLPPHWGGFRVIPDSVEFWQGRRSRLHDRISYQLSAEGAWHRTRLSP